MESRKGEKIYLTEKMPRLDSVNPTGRGDLLASSAYVQFDSKKIKTQISWLNIELDSKCIVG